MSVTYQEFKPCRKLSNYVDCFWVSKGIRNFNGQESLQNRILPDGCIDILFDFSSANKLTSSIVGTMSFPLILNHTSDVDFLGIRFLPGMIGSFIKLNAHECTDQIIDLSHFIQNEAMMWHQELLTIRTLKMVIPTSNGSSKPTVDFSGNSLRIAFCEQVLLRRLESQDHSPDPFVKYCVDTFYATKGSFDLKELSKKTGFSARQIERKFLKDVGLSPKHFARVIRFQSIDRMIKGTSGRNQINWTGIASNFGFYDQSHFIKDFKRFTGFSPEHYFGLC